MRRKLVLGVIVSAFFLYLALRGIDTDEFAAAFERVNLWWVGAGVAATMLGHFVRAWRWQFIMLPVRRVPVGPLWSAVAISFMVNNLFPARLGEFVRAYAIGRSEGVSKSAAFATIVYERVVDVFVILAFLWIVLLNVDGPDWLARSAVIIILLNGTLLALLVVMVRYKAAFRRVLERITRPLPHRAQNRIVRTSDAFADGLEVVTNMRAVIPIAFTSVIVWGLAALGIYCCFPAMGMDLPPLASLLVLVIISIGVMIPSAPAFVGTMQYACIVALAFYDVSRSDALAYAVVYHATQFFPITLAGWYYAWRASIRLSDIPSGGGQRT